MSASLAGKYNLVKWNGEKVPAGTASLELSEGRSPSDYRLHASVANVLNGSVKYEKGKLTGLIISTLMMGPPLQMEVEQFIGSGLHSGMAVQRDHEKLILSNGKQSLEYVRA